MGDRVRGVILGEVQFVLRPVRLRFHHGGVRLVLVHPGVAAGEDNERN